MVHSFLKLFETQFQTIPKEAVLEKQNIDIPSSEKRPCSNATENIGDGRTRREGESPAYGNVF